MTDDEFIQALLRQTEEAPELDDKRRAALNWLGERWLLHPANGPKKRS